MGGGGILPFCAFEAQNGTIRSTDGIGSGGGFCLKHRAIARRHIGSAIAHVAICIGVRYQSKRPESLAQLDLTTSGVDRPVVLPIIVVIVVSLNGPHHGVVVAVVLPRMIAIGHIEGVSLSMHQSPGAVLIVMVIPRPTIDARRSCILHGKRVDVIFTGAVVVWSENGRKMRCRCGGNGRVRLRRQGECGITSGNQPNCCHQQCA